MADGTAFPCVWLFKKDPHIAWHAGEVEGSISDIHEETG